MASSGNDKYSMQMSSDVVLVSTSGERISAPKWKVLNTFGTIKHMYLDLEDTNEDIPMHETSAVIRAALNFEDSRIEDLDHGLLMPLLLAAHRLDSANIVKGTLDFITALPAPELVTLLEAYTLPAELGALMLEHTTYEYVCQIQEAIAAYLPHTKRLKDTVFSDYGLKHLPSNCPRDTAVLPGEVLQRYVFIDDNVQDKLCSTCVELARDGHLFALEWLSTRHIIGRHRALAAFLSACEGGQMAVAQWLASTFGLDAKYIKSDGYKALSKACSSGNLELVKWLVSTAPPCIGANMEDSFIEACKHGVPLVQFLIDKFCPSPTKGLDVYYLLQHKACENNRAELVMWLTDTFHLATSGILPRAASMGNLELVQSLVARIGKLEDITPSMNLTHAFTNACEGGYLEVAKWLYDNYASGPVDSPTVLGADINAVFMKVCCWGHLRLAQWFAETFVLEVSPNDLLYESCRCGRLEIAKWVTETYDVDAECRVDNVVLKAAVRGRNLDIIQWLINKFGNISDADSSNNILIMACKGGALDMAKWSVATFGLTREDVRAHNNQALISACKGGHLCVAQWLAETFDLKDEDARAQDNKALATACAGGHLSVVQWLITTFGLTCEDARSSAGESSSINGAFIGACEGGHLSVAQWLTETLGLTIEDVKSHHSAALIGACVGGHLSLLKWLTSRFGLTGDDIRVWDNVTFTEACIGGHLSVAKWIADTCALTTEYVMANNNDAFIMACQEDHIDIAQWMFTKFGFTAEALPIDLDGDESPMGLWIRDTHG